MQGVCKLRKVEKGTIVHTSSTIIFRFENRPFVSKRGNTGIKEI